MSKLESYIQHNWPEARLGLDYEIRQMENGKEAISVWSDSFGEPPSVEELDAWDPAQPTLNRRKMPAEKLRERFEAASTNRDMIRVLFEAVEDMQKRVDRLALPPALERNPE